MSDFVKAIFKSRPNRFIAICDIDGKEVKAHVPNTGRCKELLIERVTVYLLPSDNPNRKTKYSLLFVVNKGELVSLYSQDANRIVFDGIKSGKVKEFLGYNILEREKVYDKSRIDIYLAKELDDKIIEDCYCEVKGVTLIKDGIAQFPDAPTTRGCKHLKELIKLKQSGHRAVVFFLIQHPAGNYFRPNWENDPDFSSTLKTAYKEGVEILVYKSNNTLDKVDLDNKSLDFTLEK
ncbi:sugar fermentation stimulation protein SfsA [Methanobrevibacter sp. 87.7]|uniref:DNA/RNA nuclease SfsA n=1 Tax=Methanobrevibacter sp. 87.7 TaxID=387957 RepID=UPI000B50E9E2|nr:DNA/RNA nuclease SfsA [Methanobrevibacter sp. 87.7]OWT32828.1 sugar fermentation stimulation protein SfsA [Methanobrevibacter sp. 87.7]